MNTEFAGLGFISPMEGSDWRMVTSKNGPILGAIMQVTEKIFINPYRHRYSSIRVSVGISLTGQGWKSLAIDG